MEQGPNLSFSYDFALSASPPPSGSVNNPKDSLSFVEVSRGRTARGVLPSPRRTEELPSPSPATDPLTTSLLLTESKQGAVTEEELSEEDFSSAKDSSEDELSAQKLVRAYVSELLSVFDDGALVKRTLSQGRNQLLATLKQRQSQAKLRVKLNGLKFQLDFKRRMRKVLTGDESRSLRRHLQESPQIKLIDKLCFVGSVGHMLVSECILFRRTHLFKFYYAAMFVFLMLFRYVTYRSRHWEYYMIDMCYFVNWLTLAHIFVFPQSQWLFECIFVLAMGPLLAATFVWRNSMVFHSTDKMTSLFIHVFPPLYLISTKWLLDADSVETAMADSLSFSSWLLSPMTLYLVWQSLYLLKTEVVDSEYLAAHTSVPTSMRYLYQAKGGIAKVMLDIHRRLGVYGKNELIDASTVKAKAVFINFNFWWTVVMCLPTKMLFASKRLSIFYLCCALAVSMFNGANYYVEVFAAAYNKILEKKHTKVVEKYESIEENLDKVFERAWQKAYSVATDEDSDDSKDSVSADAAKF